MERKLILNTKQKQAVRYSKGPLLVIAGAGTGKTTVITERIKYLLGKKVSPENILAVTFTDKAAQEMLDRLDVALPLGYQEPWLGTFHSICDRILRRDCLEIGLDPDYKIITPVEQWILIKKHLFEFELKHFRPLGNPTKFISAIIKFFSRSQDEDLDSKKLLDFAEKNKQVAKSDSQKEEVAKLFELAKAYKKYQELKIEQSLLDFGDLIIQTLKLFRKRKSLLKKYQEQFKYALVDEFQDTNFAQYQLIKTLFPAKNNPKLTVVGDDDQAVYQWRGASISNILNFKNIYPKAKEVVLTTNYRSTKSILDSSYSLIQNNNPDRLEVRLKVNKKLKARKNKKLKPPLIIKTQSWESEVDFTLKKILELISQKKYSYKDFAILSRANAHLDAYVAGLKKAGLPYQLIGNRGLFDQQEIRNLIDFLRTVVNPQDSRVVFNLLHLKVFKLDSDTVFSLLNQSKINNLSLWSILKKESSRKIQNIVNLIRGFQEQSLTKPVSKLLHHFILKTGYLNKIIKEETVENQLKIQNINLLFDILKRFETNNKNALLTDFIETLDLWQEAGENPAQAVIEDIDTINLLTVHSAKGLEFPVVFVGNLVSGRFPAINRRDPIEFPEELIRVAIPKGSQSIQEERRLLYVAMTRAKDYLYLTYSSDYGGVRERKKSKFLEETGIREIEEKPDPLQLLLRTTDPPSPEIRYLKKKRDHEIKFLSFSQIDTFLTCPLKYRYRYVLKIPAEPHHALTFGQTIHNTLHDFHRYQQQGKVPNLKKFLSIYKNNFIELGYESESHKQERFKSGITALKKYHQVFHTQLGKPTILERSFTINISGVPFVGKIDRIDKTAKGMEIIDYKTGKSANQKSVDKDKQLSIYGLAAKEAFGLDIRKLSFYYIEENIKLSTQRTEDKLKTEREYIKIMIKNIKNSDFKAKPGYPFPCQFCEYNRICPYAKKK